MSVLLLATGGTIASRPRPEDGAVTASLKGADLLATAGADRGDVDVVDIAHGPSWNFEPEFQAEVAWTARQALAGGDVDGVVVTHGTDTVEETLWLAELLGRDATDRGPIVFTAAMRHAAETAADGPRNLADSLAVARSAEARGRGALLCVNGELHHARWVTKTDTVAVSTFRSPAAAPVGRVVAGVPVFAIASPAPPPPHPADGRIDTAVAQIRSRGGIDGGVVDWHVGRGAHGLVVEGTGAGNVNAALIPGLERAVGAGIPVVLASRCLTGPVAPIYGGPGGGAELATLGLIPAGDLGANRARLALMVALAVDRSIDGVRSWFATLVG